MLASVGVAQQGCGSHVAAQASVKAVPWCSSTTLGQEQQLFLVHFAVSAYVLEPSKRAPFFILSFFFFFFGNLSRDPHVEGLRKGVCSARTHDPPQTVFPRFKCCLRLKAEDFKSMSESHT